MTIPAALTRHAPGRRLEDLPIAALLVSVEHERVSGANELAEELFGFPLGDIVGVSLREILPGLGELALRREEVTVARVEALRGGGTPFPAEVRLRALPSRPAEVLCVVSRLSDADVVARAATHFEAAFDHAPIGMALFNCDGEYIRVNSTLCAMLGRGEDELLGRRDQELTYPDDRAQDVEVAWRILRGELDTHQTEKRFVRPDGSLVWTIANLTFLREDGRALAWLGQFQDITELRRTGHELQRLADVDPLTGCLNRRRGLEALEDAVAVDAGGPGTLGLLMIDLDRFKQINDGYGHLAGDDVLRASSDAIAACLEDGHDLVRYGGEEFMALLPATTPARAAEIAEQIRAAIARLEVRAGDRPVPVRTSVGVATLEAPHDTAQSLMARADTGLYRAKAAGRNRVVAV